MVLTLTKQQFPFFLLNTKLLWLLSCLPLTLPTSTQPKAYRSCWFKMMVLLAINLSALLISKGAMTDSKQNNLHILGYQVNDMHLKTLWHLSQTNTVYTVCFYSVYWSMSLVDTLTTAFMTCLLDGAWTLCGFHPHPGDGVRLRDDKVCISGFHLSVVDHQCWKNLGFKFTYPMHDSTRNFALNQIQLLRRCEPSNAHNSTGIIHVFGLKGRNLEVCEERKGGRNLWRRRVP